MAKQGIPAFLLDCFLDDKMELIEAEYGLDGFAIIIKLWQKIYSGNGYYCDWSDEVALLFAKKINAGANVVSEVVSTAVRRGVFDNELYQQYGILTSAGIQKRYFDVISRRKNIEVNTDYLLIDLCVKNQNADISSKNADISSKNADISATSKGKVTEGNISKDNLTKENKSKNNQSSATTSTLSREKNSSENENVENIVENRDEPLVYDNAYKAERDYYDWSEYTEEEMSTTTPLYITYPGVKLTIAELDIIFKCIPNKQIYDDYIYKLQFYRDIKDQFTTVLRWALKDGNYKDIKD